MSKYRTCKDCGQLWDTEATHDHDVGPGAMRLSGDTVRDLLARLRAAEAELLGAEGVDYDPQNPERPVPGLGRRREVARLSEVVVIRNCELRNARLDCDDLRERLAKAEGERDRYLAVMTEQSKALARAEAAEARVAKLEAEVRRACEMRVRAQQERDEARMTNAELGERYVAELAALRAVAEATRAHQREPWRMSTWNDLCGALASLPKVPT